MLPFNLKVIAILAFAGIGRENQMCSRLLVLAKLLQLLECSPAILQYGSFQLILARLSVHSLTHMKLHQTGHNWLYFSLQALYLLSYFGNAGQITFAKQRFLLFKERFRLAENLRSACYLPSVFPKVLLLVRQNAPHAWSQRPFNIVPILLLMI